MVRALVSCHRELWIQTGIDTELETSSSSSSSSTCGTGFAQQLVRYSTVTSKYRRRVYDIRKEEGTRRRSD